MEKANDHVKEFNHKLEAEVILKVNLTRTAVMTVQMNDLHYHDHVFVNSQRNLKESEGESRKDQRHLSEEDYQGSKRIRKEKDTVSQDRKARTRLLEKSRTSSKDKVKAKVAR